MRGRVWAGQQLRHQNDPLENTPTSPPSPPSLLTLAIPLATDQAGSFAASIVSAAVIAATLGPAATAALFLGRTLVSATGLAPVLGSLTAIETFAGAAHGAATVEGQGGARAALGLTLQRALALATVAGCAAATLWTLCGTPLLISLGQDPSLAAPAARFAVRWVPALLLWGASEACRRTAVAQGAVRACACVSLCVLASSRPLTSILTARSGLDGADTADALMATLSLCGMVAVLAALDASRPPSDRALRHGVAPSRALHPAALAAHAAVAAPAAAMVCLSWWAGQAAVVVAGTLQNPGSALAASGVVLNMRAVSYMLADGLATAAAVRVAVELGGGKPATAATAAKLATTAGAVVGGCAAVAVVAARHAWSVALCPAGSACSTIAASSAPALGVAMLAEATAGAAAGGLRGCGRQARVAGASLALAWGVGLPLQAWLALAPPAIAIKLGLGPGVPGLLAGGAAASSALAVWMVGAATTTRWREEADRAAAAVAAAHGEGGEPLLQGEEAEF